MRRVISHRVRLSLIVYSSTSQKKCLQIPCIILSLKGNLIWTCSVWPVMSLSVAFIPLAKKAAIDFCQFFFSYWGYCSHWIYKIKRGEGGSPCPFKRKGAFISLSSLVWGRSLTFCTHTRSCAWDNEANIVHSRNAPWKLRNHSAIWDLNSRHEKTLGTRFDLRTNAAVC